MAEYWEWWNRVLHFCTVMWFNLNTKAQNRSIFDRTLLKFLEPLRCLLQLRLVDRGRNSLEWGKKQKAEKGKTWKPSPTAPTEKSCSRKMFIFTVC
jgi:hypothetical protein